MRKKTKSSFLYLIDYVWKGQRNRNRSNLFFKYNTAKLENRSKNLKMELKRIEKRQKAPYDGDLCRAIFPIYYLGKLCGVVPVRFYVRASEGCQARLNIIDLVYR